VKLSVRRTVGSFAIMLAVVGASGCGTKTNEERAAEARGEAREKLQARQVQQTCASTQTNDRIKQYLFEEAIRIRNADPVNLDKLASFSLVRIEKPVVKSRDPELDVTVCDGQLILQLPPGAERAFGGEHRLDAEIEYAAQAAADGSGLIYRVKGAEPIIYKLAAFDLRGQTYRAPAGQEPTQVAAAEVPSAAPIPVEAPRPIRTAVASPPPPPAPPAPRATPRPSPKPSPTVVASRAPAPRPTATAAAPRSSPSFDCRRARTRSEKMVCGSDRLAALDRAMSSQFYASLSGADSRTRSALRTSRDRFLAYRERCPNEACVAEAYRDRIDEIRDISAGR
jgi:hypothetical protein